MNTKELNNIIGKAARAVTDDWPGTIEADDLRQEIWVKIAESPKYLEQMNTYDAPLRLELLKKLGRQIAGAYVNDYELFSGNAFYGSEHVRRLLDAGILTIARYDLAEMKETLTDFLDAQESFDALKNRNTSQAQVIWSAYVTNEYDSTSTSERRLLSRAVKSLTELMNQAHRRRYSEREDGLGSRTIMSNARSRAISSNQWDGPRVF